MPSPHKQPRELAELKGTTRTHPDRYRGEVPKSAKPLGQPPKHLSEEAKAAWFEIESYALPGVLTGAERMTMELLANFIVAYRANPAEFPANKYPPMISCLARLGMTPADRQKLAVTKPDAKVDPMDEFTRQ